MSRRSFNSVRSYFFREQCARIDREQREYGGRSLDDLDLDDFRAIWFAATSTAVRHIQASLRVYNRRTKQWEQRI